MDFDDLARHARHHAHRCGRLDVAHHLKHTSGILTHDLLHAHARGLYLPLSLLIVGTCRQTQHQQHARQKTGPTFLF